MQGIALVAARLLRTHSRGVRHGGTRTRFVRECFGDGTGE